MKDQSAALTAVAADARAGELHTTVTRIDLSATVSQYVGETEAHLGAVFADAERAGAVLLVDEADALFGTRTGVKDSHDRYANLDVSSLLARVEQYNGVVLLATNVRSNIDPAFSRRLRRVIDYTPR